MTNNSSKLAAEIVNEARAVAQSAGFSVVKDGSTYTLRLNGANYAFGFGSASEAWTWARTKVHG